MKNIWLRKLLVLTLLLASSVSVSSAEAACYPMNDYGVHIPLTQTGVTLAAATGLAYWVAVAVQPGAAQNVAFGAALAGGIAAGQTISSTIGFVRWYRNNGTRKVVVSQPDSPAFEAFYQVQSSRFQAEGRSIEPRVDLWQLLQDANALNLLCPANDPMSSAFRNFGLERKYLSIEEIRQKHLTGELATEVQTILEERRAQNARSMELFQRRQQQFSDMAWRDFTSSNHRANRYPQKLIIRTDRTSCDPITSEVSTRYQVEVYSAKNAVLSEKASKELSGRVEELEASVPTCPICFEDLEGNETIERIKGNCDCHSMLCLECFDRIQFDAQRQHLSPSCPTCRAGDYIPEFRFVVSPNESTPTNLQDPSRIGEDEDAIELEEIVID